MIKDIVCPIFSEEMGGACLRIGLTQITQKFQTFFSRWQIYAKCMSGIIGGILKE
jgi:hypothetical protein